MTEKVKIKVLPGGRMPEKKTAGAAAWDCYARIEKPNKGLVYNCESIIIPLGFCMEVPHGYHAEIYLRSSMGLKTMIMMSNAVGIIDSDYRGEVGAILKGIDCESVMGSFIAEIKDGDRVAQMIIVKDPDVELVQAEDLSKTDRGTGGFGSTGKR